jgi:small subunit ribosomal protein S20
MNASLILTSIRLRFDANGRGCYHRTAGWSSLVARWAHNPKVGGSNPPPATNFYKQGNEADMANHFSALKRARQTERRTARNRANASRLRGTLRELRETIEKGDKSAAEKVYRTTVSVLDKAIQKGTLHENTASRYKSRLGKRVIAMK